MSTKELERVAFAELTEELAARGFRKRAGIVYTSEIAEGITGIARMNRSIPAPYDAVILFPVVGVRHEPSARIVDRIRGWSAWSRFSTVEKGLYTLVPWLGPGDGNWGLTADRLSRQTTLADLMRCMDAAGIPFMLSLSTPQRVLGFLDSDSGARSRFQAAVLRWSIGERDSALKDLRLLVQYGEASERGTVSNQYAPIARVALELLESGECRE